MSFIQQIDRRHIISREVPEQWVIHAGRFDYFEINNIGNIEGVSFACRVFESENAEAWLFNCQVDRVDIGAGNIAIRLTAEQTSLLHGKKQAYLVIDVSAGFELRNFMSGSIPVDPVSTALQQIEPDDVIDNNGDVMPPVIATTKTATTGSTDQGYSILSEEVSNGQTVYRVEEGAFVAGTARLYYGDGNAAVRITDFQELPAEGRIIVNFQANQTAVLDYETV